MPREGPKREGTAEGAPRSVIGLEVHVQLATRTKLFCGCENRFGAPPNSLVCPVCLGYPGALPSLNRRAVDLALSLALALGATVRERSGFDRKCYFYPDLPKGYQITQWRRPLADGGWIPIGDGQRVGIRRLHIEEDAGKLVHQRSGGPTRPRESLVDFNRAGIPLVEIVTEPGLETAREARTALRTIRDLVTFLGVGDGSLAEGSLRCDANVSLSSSTGIPSTRTEIKNLNSYRFLSRAIDREIERQRDILASGNRVAAATLGYDPEDDRIHVLRTKEENVDYRYQPEPDLPPIRVDPTRLDAVAEELPAPPWERHRRLVANRGLRDQEAATLVSDRRLADFAEAVMDTYGGPASRVGHWIRSEVFRLSSATGRPPWDGVSVGDLAELVEMVDREDLSRAAGKEVLEAIWGREESPAAAAARLDLGQVTDLATIRRWVEEVLAEHSEEAAELRDGRRALVGYFVGLVMERSGRRADPRRVRAVIEERIP